MSISPRRCETEERNTRRLEEEVALLRETKRTADHSSMILYAEVHRSMTELQEMHREFEVIKCSSVLPSHSFVFLTLLSFLSSRAFPSACTVVTVFQSRN